MVIWTIATRTFLRNIYDFRFLIGMVLVICAVGLSAFLSISEMSARQRAFAQLRQAASETANLENIKLVRKPAPLSFLYEGGEDELPRYLIVTSDMVDLPIEVVSAQAVVEPFVHLDWAFIALYFYGLLAILLTFDLISGQKELRILAMVLAQPVSRGALLVGSYVGTLLTLLPALLTGFLIYLVSALLGGIWGPSGEDWLRLLVILLLSLLFVSATALLGILASASFGRSAVSLTAAFLVWAMVTVVAPSAIKLVVQLSVPAPSFRDLQTSIGSARAEYKTKLPMVWSMDIARIVNRPGLTLQQRQKAISDYQSEILRGDLEAIAWYRSNLRRLRAEYLSRYAYRAHVIRRLEMLSPSAAFQRAIEAIVGTGQTHLANFTRSAESYMHTYTDYVAEKREQLKDQSHASGFAMEESGVTVRSVAWIDYSRVEFDRTSLPGFEDSGASLRFGISTALLDFALLGFLNVVLFALAYRAILRCSVN